MAAECSPPASLPSSRSGRPKKSNKEMKMALVAKRLAMLQDEYDHDQDYYNHSVAVEPPKQQLSEITSGMMQDSADNLPATDDTVLRICESNDSARDNDKAAPSKEIARGPSIIRLKCGSHKQLEFIGDDKQAKDERISTWIHATKNKSSKRKKISNDVSDHASLKASDSTTKGRIRMLRPSDDSSVEMLSSAMKRANDVQANLSAEYPSFVKLMLVSHVSRVFWLHLPTQFCHDHLPNCDCTVTLVDEAGQAFETKYLAKKSALSGGWRGFAIQHKMREGDVAVFQSIDSITFKVYIVREDNLGKALEILPLNTCDGQQISDPEEHAQEPVDMELSPLRLQDSVSPSSSEVDVGPEVLDELCFSDSAANSEAAKSFENPNIIVDGLILDSMLSDVVRKKYNDLCHSQTSLLHENLVKGLNCSLVVGIISEITNIADAIRACTSSTSVEDLQTWEKTLKGFELLGMKVDFMCAKLDQLLAIASESDMANNSTMFQKCELERSRAGKRIRAIESKLSNLRELLGKIDMEMDAEMATAQKHRDTIKKLWPTLP